MASREQASMLRVRKASILTVRKHLSDGETRAPVLMSLQTALRQSSEEVKNAGSKSTQPLPSEKGKKFGAPPKSPLEKSQKLKHSPKSSIEMTNASDLEILRKFKSIAQYQC